MLKRSRKLRFIKWAGLVGCVVLVCAWISNLWWSYDVWGCGAFGFAEGCIAWSTDSGDTPGLHLGLWRTYGILWLPRVIDLSYRRCLMIFVPNWMFLSVLLPITIWLWHRDRRPPPGHCKGCGYNLTGNISGTCPECGTEFHASRQQKEQEA